MGAEATPLLRARGLAKHFYAATSVTQLLRGKLRGRRIDALRGIDLDVAPGEIVALLGENGAGKSTLLRLIAGLLIADAGELEVFGEVVARARTRKGRAEGEVVEGACGESASAAYRARVCYVLADERSFSWRLDGRQNLEFFASLHGLGGAERQERVDAALEQVGLVDAADRGVREYSTGMRQRLALARGLLGDAELFLFDEPTRGVDPRHAAELRAFIGGELLQGRTALVATHDLEEVRQLSERVLVLDEGVIVGQGSSGEAAELLGMGVGS